MGNKFFIVWIYILLLGCSSSQVARKESKMATIRINDKDSLYERIWTRIAENLDIKGQKIVFSPPDSSRKRYVQEVHHFVASRKKEQIADTQSSFNHQGTMERNISLDRSEQKKADSYKKFFYLFCVLILGAGIGAWLKRRLG